MTGAHAFTDSVLTSVLLPIALAFIMFGLELSLTTGDFARVARMPRAVLVALGTQVVLLPVICLGLVEVFGLAPALAVGMMLQVFAIVLVPVALGYAVPRAVAYLLNRRTTKAQALTQ